jgi:hypothetical protein
VDQTLAVLASQGISSLADLCHGEDLAGVKGLKQIGLATPAAWALHSAMEKMKTTSPNASALPEPNEAATFNAVGGVLKGEERTSSTTTEPSTAPESETRKKVWGYALEGDSSTSESEGGQSEEEGTGDDKAKEGQIEVVGGEQQQQQAPSWRRNFVTMDSSSSSEDEARG